MWARPVGAVLVTAHLSAVYWLIWRSADGPWAAAGSASPLGTIRTYLALGPMAAVGHLGGALLLLAPLGFLLPLAVGGVNAHPLGSFARTTFAGMMLAFGTEVVRAGLSGQVFDLDVLLLNTAGVALAHLAVVPAARAALRRRGWGRAPTPSWPPDDEPPTSRPPEPSRPLPAVELVP